MSKQNLKIVLLAGGASSERQVSKQSSKGIYDALTELGYDTSVVDPALGLHQPKDVTSLFEPDDGFGLNGRNYPEILQLPQVQQADVAFLGLHGKYGEDGKMQALLELAGIRYTGSGVMSCSVAMNKDKAKSLFKDHGIVVPEGFMIQKGAFTYNEVVQRIEDELGYPVIIKPNDEGSTIGLSIVHSLDELPAALEESFKYSRDTLVERFIPGREMTIGVLDGKALPAIEIIPKHELYDYECKYTPGMSAYVVPAQIPEFLSKSLARQALIAYNALECRGYARVDFRVSADNRHYCLELNPLPGMTGTSLIPKAASAIGLSYKEVVESIVRAALR
ncbi:D-alanine-D-alanine ligase [uncultured bacterium]|nr:D-alanine-D-alanine ligase [uncultured bacterium]